MYSSCKVTVLLRFGIDIRPQQKQINQFKMVFGLVRDEKVGT